MVISTVNQVIYNGDGITTAWPYTFRIIDATDIKLTIIDADGTETDVSADYYVDTVNSTVYYPGYAPGAEPPEEDQPPVLPVGKKLLIYRQLPVTQEKDLGEKWPFEVIELALDKLTMILQQVYEWWGRCLKISSAARAEHPDFDLTFPVEAGKSFRINADATGFEVSDDPGPYAAIAAEAAETAAEAAEAAEAAAALVDVQAFWFDGASDMKSANLPVGATAGTKGYYSVDDGGSAIYNIRTMNVSDVDDGGSIIFLDNGNVAELVAGNTINVKMFGAVGNGVSDDFTAFDNALDFAISKGKKIAVSDGTYLLSKPVITDKGYVDFDNGTYTSYPLVVSDAEKFSKVNGPLDCVYAKEPSYYAPAADGVYYHLQSAGYNSDKDTVLLVFCGIKNGVNDQPGKLVEVTADFKTILNTVVYDIEHGNGVTYCQDNQRWYVALWNSPGIMVFDDDLNYIETVATDANYATVAYDKENKIFYAASTKVSVFDINFVKIDELPIVNSVYEPDKTTIMTRQDGEVINGQYVALHFTNKYVSLTSYNYETGEINNQAIYSNRANEEPEGLFVKDNFVYVVSYGYMLEFQRFLLNNVMTSELSGTNMYLGVDTDTNDTHIIASSDDLDDKVAYGKYNCASSTVAATLSNCPVWNSGFMMFSILNGYEKITQIIIDNSGRMFTRKGDLDNNTWTDWLGSTHTTQSESFTLPYNFTVGGFLTTGGTSIQFSIPIPKTMLNINMTPAITGKVIIRGLLSSGGSITGGYLNSNGSTGNNITGYTISYNKSPDYLHIELAGTWATGNINNSPVSVALQDASISFTHQ